jgi:hypothetical protein
MHHLYAGYAYIMALSGMVVHPGGVRHGIFNQFSCLVRLFSAEAPNTAAIRDPLYKSWTIHHDHDNKILKAHYLISSNSLYTMCDVVFALGENDSYYLECPSRWCS